MAVNFSTKVIGVVTIVITVIFGELYVYTLHWEAKAKILRAHFVVFVESFLLILSKFVWNNFSNLQDQEENSGRSLKKAKYSDNNLQNKSTETPRTNWTAWKVFLILFLGSCHLSYLTNYISIGREPNAISYSCYAALGLLFQVVPGMIFLKVGTFIIERIIQKPLKLLTKVRRVQLVLIYAIPLWMYGVYNAASAPVVKEVLIPVKGLPLSLDGLKIVQISDVHLGPTVGRWRLNRIVSIINEQDPDIVVMTGDLVDGSVQALKEAVEPATDIKSKFGKFFISGNHEYYTGDVDNWFSHLRKLGFKVLHNSNVMVPRHKRIPDQLCLAGIDDLEALRIGYGDHGMNLAKALSSCEKTQPVVLLAHQPKAAKLALDSQYRVDVVISGHTHGGQFFPMTLAVYFFNPFHHGLYEYGESSHVYVSMGTQYWGIPVRIGTTMEITRIILKTPS